MDQDKRRPGKVHCVVINKKVKAECEEFTPHSALCNPHFGYGSSSTFQYASLMNLAQLATGACRVAYSGCHLGREGFAWSLRWASLGVRSAFFLLHSMQASTQFSQVLVPPRDRGTMWSIVIESSPGRAPQYWHVS